MRCISTMVGVVGFLFGAGNVAAEIPADPPVHTYWTGGLIWVGAEDEHIWLKSREPVEGKHTYSSISLPVNRLSPEKEDFKVDSGLLPISVTSGLLYGMHGWPDRRFRVVDPSDEHVVLDHLLSNWRWSSDRHFPYPHGYTDYKEAAGNSPDALFRFDAAALTATERPIYGVNSGNHPSQRMLGAGESWLAFRRWTDLSDQKIVITDPVTLTDRFSLSFDSRPSFGYNTASSNDAVYVVVNDQLLAINGHTGTREVVFDAAATGFWNGSPFAAWGDDLWTYLGGDVRLWRKGNAEKWENIFRGRLPGWDGIPYAQPKLVATSRGLFVKEEHRVHFFSAEASRPVLKPWNTARFSETAGAQALWLELDRPWGTPVTVRVKSVGGTAAEGLDYTAVDQDVVFQPGQTRVAVPVSITSDLIPEANETIRFELSDPRGLTLPENREGSGVILASGLQLDEWIPESPGNGEFSATIIQRNKGITAGFIDDATRQDNGAVYLWDSATGQLRGRTPFSLASNQSREAHFLELDGKLEGIQVVGNSVIWHELNPANGSSLRSREMSPGITPRGMALLGGGRVLFIKNELGPSVVTGFVMSADGPLGAKQEIEIPDGPQYSVSIALVSDGRYLAMGWSSHDLAEGYPRLLRWYDARTLEVLGERNVNSLARCEPVALRGELLLCKSAKGVVALRVPSGELAWQVDNVEIAATGDDYWFSRS